MKRHLKKELFRIFIVTTFLYLIFSGFVQADTHTQPYMEVALKHLEKALNVRVGKMIQLEKARKNLVLSAWDKGGHRVKAIELVDQAKKATKKRDITRANTLIEEAIDHVKVGVGYSDEHTEEPPEVDLETNQPYIELALKHLEKALIADTVNGKVTNLNRAKTNLRLGISNKGGYRVKALNKVNKALKLINRNKITEADILIKEAIELVKKAIENGAVKK